MKNEIPRTLACAICAFAFAASAGSASAQGGTLNIYNWGNYTSPELISKFEAETGISVTLTDYDSNDTALARVQTGGHGFDIVVPTSNYIPIWIESGLLLELDPQEIPNIANIEERWVDVDFDPGRRFSVPWVWGTTGTIVNTSIYDGDPNTAEIFLDPPDELKGRINIVPEMSPVMSMAIYHFGGEQCTGDMDLLRQVRDALNEARQHWISLDYGSIDMYASGDVAAGVYWNGAAMRARAQNPDLVYGYPRTGYPVWMDNAAILADAQNPEGAKAFINFILEPENAALISNFTRYASGVEGAGEFIDAEMNEAPEVVVPAEFLPAGRLSVTCPPEIQRLYTQIWTELLR